MTLREVFEAFDSKKKHKLMFYFWMVTIPFVLGFATSSYCILTYGDEIGERLMLTGMKVKSAGMTHIVEDLGYLDIDSEAIAAQPKKYKK